MRMSVLFWVLKSRNPGVVTQSQGVRSDGCSLLSKGHYRSCSSPARSWLREVPVPACPFQCSQTTGSSFSPL